MKRRTALALVFALALAALPAQEEPERGEAGGITSARVLNFTVTTLPEAKLDFNWSWTIPLLRGENFLVSGNNLKIALPVSVTPVSLSGGLDLTLTPVALAQIRAGGSIGSGWNFPGLAPQAFGLNVAHDGTTGDVDAAPGQKDPARTGGVAGDPFEAAVWKVYGGVVLQFDLGAVIPGDWTHVQVQTYQQVFYRANTLAADGEPWSFENDGGENLNGFKYYSSYTLAYQLPAVSPVFRTLALQAELEWRLYGLAGGSAWGEELPACYFSAVANFEITPRVSFATIVQLSYDRNFTNWRRRQDEAGSVYYRDRALLDGNPMNLNFHRFAGIFSFKI